MTSADWRSSPSFMSTVPAVARVESPIARGFNSKVARRTGRLTATRTVTAVPSMAVIDPLVVTRAGLPVYAGGSYPIDRSATTGTSSTFHWYGPATASPASIRYGISPLAIGSTSATAKNSPGRSPGSSRTDRSPPPISQRHQTASSPDSPSTVAETSIGRPAVTSASPGETSRIETRRGGSIDANGANRRPAELNESFGASSA